MGLHVYFNKHARDNTSFSKRKVYARSAETQKKKFNQRMRVFPFNYYQKIVTDLAPGEHTFHASETPEQCTANDAPTVISRLPTPWRRVCLI